MWSVHMCFLGSISTRMVHWFSFRNLTNSVSHVKKKERKKIESVLKNVEGERRTGNLKKLRGDKTFS